MGSVRDGVRHAFAVDPPGPAQPTLDQQAAVDWICKQVARRHLTTPSLIALEMTRPLNSIFSHTLQFFSPGVWALLRQRNYKHYEHFATFLERRGAMEYLERRIEHFEANAQ